MMNITKDNHTPMGDSKPRKPKKFGNGNFLHWYVSAPLSMREKGKCSFVNEIKKLDILTFQIYRQRRSGIFYACFGTKGHHHGC